ncbi:MAG: sigma factor [Gammaproteobacteria bacterium]
MERAEFDRWIETHYNDLLAVARRRTNTPEDAQDTVQAAVARVLPHVPAIRAPWTFVVNAVASEASNRRLANARQTRVKTEVRRVAKNFSSSAVSQGWKRPAPRAD